MGGRRISISGTRLDASLEKPKPSIPSTTRRPPIATRRKAPYIWAKIEARRLIEEKQAAMDASGPAIAQPAPIVIANPHGLGNHVPNNRRDLDDNIVLNTVGASEDLHGNGDPIELAMPWLIEEFQRAFALGTREPGQEWSVWHAAKDYAPGGYIFWFGFSQNVPSEVIERVRSSVCFFIPSILGTRHAGKDGLRPLLWMGNEGIELQSMF